MCRSAGRRDIFSQGKGPVYGTLSTSTVRSLLLAFPEKGAAEPGGQPLRLARSRHRTLSFRFDPPDQWRSHVPTRDGRTYPFAVVRAVYETLPQE